MCLFSLFCIFKTIPNWLFLAATVCLDQSELAAQWRVINVKYFNPLLCLSSVPDLSEYQVWLGVSDIQEGASDWSKRQEVSIDHVICGPEGSSLALIRLSKWVKILKDILAYICACMCVCLWDADHHPCSLNMSRPALPADNVHTIQLPVAGCSIPDGTICKMYGWGETKGTDILYFTFTTAVVIHT